MVVQHTVAMRDYTLRYHAATSLVQVQFEAMASDCEILVDATTPQACSAWIESILQDVWRIEEKYSRFRNDNVWAAIHRGDYEKQPLDDETQHLLNFADELYKLSDGLFDITSGVLSKLWRFDGSSHIPNAEQLRTVLRQVGWQRVKRHAACIHVPSGTLLDLGGIGKEYAVDRVFDQLKKHTTHAVLVNLGGDLRATGPRHDGTPWSVGREQLSNANTLNDALKDASANPRLILLNEGALATSGDTKRFILHQGQRYGHIIHPKTGWPIQGAPRQVTVLSHSCLHAGMLSTLAMLQGEGAVDFLQAQHVQFWVN